MGTGVSFVSVPPIEREKRVTQAGALVRRFAEDTLGVELRGDNDVPSFCFNSADDPWARRAANHLEKRISAILKAPLPPKAVDLVPRNYAAGTDPLV
jgi:hypothetical protein